MTQSVPLHRVLFSCIIVAIVVASLGIHLTILPVHAAATRIRLTASDGAAGGYFGRSVAVDGDTALVAGVNSTYLVVYVFVRAGTTWSQQATLTASDPDGDFGFSLSLSGDTAVVGAHFASSPALYSGAAYVFVRTGTRWSQQAKLTPSDGAAGDNFGVGVAINGDTILATGNGSDYVFVRNGTTWTQQAKLTTDDGTKLAGSVSVDGDTALTAGVNSTYVFVRSGTTWSQQAKINIGDGIVSLSGNTAAIPALHDAGSGMGLGAVHVFVRTGTTWSQQAKLTTSDLITGEGFGSPLSIEGDNLLVSSSHLGGSAYLFVRTGTSWSQQARMRGVSYIGHVDNFGSSVSVKGDVLLVGAVLDDALGLYAGAAYVFSPLSDVSSPPAPQNLQVTPGDSEVSLSWAAPSSDFSPLLQYRIYRGTIPGSLTVLVTSNVGSAETSYADNSAMNNVTYYYQVSAINEYGEGPRSSEVSATPSVYVDTIKPTVTITSPTSGATLTLSSTRVTVSGTASDNVEVQKVEVSTNGTSWVLAGGTTYWDSVMTLQNGENTLYARATDTSGNNATTTIHVTVSLQTIQSPVAPLLSIIRLAAFVGAGVVIAALAFTGIFLLLRRATHKGRSEGSIAQSP